MARAKNPASIAEVRAWARENGHNVGSRGRLNSEVVAAFTKATRRPIGQVEQPATR